MMVDTRVYGYIGDGEVFHASAGCAPGVRRDPETGRSFEGDDEVRPVYSVDDTESGGLMCDRCSDYIFEPTCPECFQATAGTDDQGEGELCEVCSDLARSDAEDPEAELDDVGEAYREVFDQRRAELDPDRPHPDNLELF